MGSPIWNPPPPFKRLDSGDIKCGCCDELAFAHDGDENALLLIKRHLGYFDDGDCMLVVQCRCGAEYARLKQPDPMRGWLAPVVFRCTA